MVNKIGDLQPFIANNTTAPAAGKQTGNAFSMIEQTMPYASGPPPHFHPYMEEMFYVIEGEITIWIEGKISKFTPGTFGLIPRKAVHYFKVTGKENCRALNMYTPSGFEEGITRNGEKAETLNLPPRGLEFKGKHDMHHAVNIAVVDLLNL